MLTNKLCKHRNETRIWIHWAKNPKSRRPLNTTDSHISMIKKWEQASWTCFWNLLFHQIYYLLIHMSCCVQQPAKRTSKRSHPLFRHTFWLWLLGTSKGWALEWNCHGKFETNCDYCFAVVGKMMLADPSVIMQNIFSSVPLLFLSKKKKSDVFHPEAIHLGIQVTLYFFFFFSEWKESCLTV